MLEEKLALPSSWHTGTQEQDGHLSLGIGTEGRSPPCAQLWGLAHVLFLLIASTNGLE